MIFRYDPEKNVKLKNERSINFEDIIYYIENEKILAVIEHPNQTKYPSQHIYLIDVDNYVYAVPFIKEKENVIFLKTIFPSRNMTKKYLKNKE